PAVGSRTAHILHARRKNLRSPAGNSSTLIGGFFKIPSFGSQRGHSQVQPVVAGWQTGDFGLPPFVITPEQFRAALPLTAASIGRQVMAISLRATDLHAQTISRATKVRHHFVWIELVAIASLAFVELATAATGTEFHRTLTVSPAEVVRLDIDLQNGDL